MNKVCAFSTADDAYVPSAAVSLLSIRKWNKDIPLFIISHSLKRKTKKFLQRYNIQYIETDLSDVFTQSWEYPVECYYLFAGPQLLSERGFTHSLYIDGDIYCNSDPIDQLLKTKTIAGVPNGNIDKILGEDFEKVKDVWKNTTATGATERLQTGVLYLNHVALTEFQFLTKVGELFKTAIAENIPRKGDDSLFSLFQYAYPELTYEQLDNTYNFITKGSSTDSEWLTQDERQIHDGIFYHFTGHPKPWSDDLSFPTYTYKYFVLKWRQHLIDTLFEYDVKRYFPNISQLLTDEHLRFYWYPSDNVGDLVTPYYLQKVCKVDNLEKYTIEEETITKIEAGETVGLWRSFFRKARESRGAKYCVSTGSVIRLCGDQALVYGSGIRSKGQEVHRSYVRCVRGPLTRARFVEEGYECPPIYGDPALLLPRFYTPTKTKSYKLGIIPHFTEYERVRKLYKDEADVVVIDLGTGRIEEALDTIASCYETVSSSLHGLVFSHAYSIPTRRIMFSDQIFGDGTKFSDYYGGIGVAPAKPIAATDFKKVSVEELIAFKKETVAFDDTRLYDAMFFNEEGFRPSAKYPF